MSMLVKTFICLCALFVSVQGAVTLRVGNGKVNPDTVDELDIPKYLGLWYQIAADQIVYSTFEKDAYCCTALYGDNGAFFLHFWWRLIFTEPRFHFIRRRNSQRAQLCDNIFPFWDALCN